MYFAWYFAEGSIISCGIILQHIPKTKYYSSSSGFSNTDPLILEFQIYRLRDYVVYWNVRSQEWLSHDIHVRMVDLLGPKWARVSTFYVFLISALWHGMYPGYFLALLSISLYSIAEKKLAKRIRMSTGPPIWLRCLGTIVLYVSMIYFLVPFVLLTWSRSIEYWASFYYIPHILVLGIVLL
jgi:lysophospholipid acyltransferase